MEMNWMLKAFSVLSAFPTGCSQARIDGAGHLLKTIRVFQADQDSETVFFSNWRPSSRYFRWNSIIVRSKVGESVV